MHLAIMTSLSTIMNDKDTTLFPMLLEGALPLALTALFLLQDVSPLLWIKQTNQFLSPSI